ncbi:GNAT family N-acetyltransferase [Paraclostridium sordellii]|uniref:GNAT family N-acetyltransferase n=1 Tax=Paraclostridium sordellii TaxID=1505 RepID=UPI0005E4E896|nr:GNAT family N-acetyltransferase [Paeniclostridium sordellii]CEO20447.1 putative acetyltransferase [[Clostridium] sordellii] [Paeniclostridium sordellii]
MIKTILDNKYLIKSVNTLNHSEIKKLYDLCSDYHIMSSGKNATDEDVDNIFKYNDKKTAENSLTLGVYNKFELLIGIVDIFKNYPENDTWMIGLLLLSPEERNKNLGKIIHEEVKNYALSQGANTLRIGVMEENIKGKRFWDSLGYKKVKSTTINMGDKKHSLDILILSIK